MSSDPDYVPHTPWTKARVDVFLGTLFVVLMLMFSLVLMEDCAPEHPRVVPRGENKLLFGN